MITGFQFKAAIAVIKLTAKEISEVVGLHQATLLRFKHTSNLEHLNCHTRTLILLETFFSKKKIIFPNSNTIKYTAIDTKEKLDNNVLNRFQLVTARIATGLNQHELSKQIRVSAGTVSLLELLENNKPIINRKIKLKTLKGFFERLGIIFHDNSTVSINKDPSLFFKKSSNVD